MIRREKLDAIVAVQMFHVARDADPGNHPAGARPDPR
jgi:hypothetical protein